MLLFLMLLTLIMIVISDAAVTTVSDYGVFSDGVVSEYMYSVLLMLFCFCCCCC